MKELTIAEQMKEQAERIMHLNYKARIKDIQIKNLEKANKRLKKLIDKQVNAELDGLIHDAAEASKPIDWLGDAGIVNPDIKGELP